MAGNIFVSYRRDDSKHAAGRLVDRLQTRFDRDHLFLDVDNIELGLDFVEVIKERVAACDVMLVVIGPQWLNAAREDGTRRLDDPRDFVRLEVEAALERNVRVIPVLVDGASPLTEDDLPDCLAPLANRQSTRLAHESFATDAESLTASLARIVGTSTTPDPPDPKPDDSPEIPSAGTLGWCAALGPAIFGGVLFLVIFTLDVPESAFEWFGPSTRGAQVAFTLPLAGTLLLWALRGVSSRSPVPRYVKAIGGLLIVGNVVVVVMAG